MTNKLPENKYERLNFYKKDECSLSFLQEALTDQDSYCRAAAARHKNCPIELTTEFFKQEKVVWVRDKIISETSDANLLFLGIKDENATVRKSAAKNKNAGRDILEIAINDPDKKVRDVIFTAKNADNELKRKAAAKNLEAFK